MSFLSSLGGFLGPAADIATAVLGYKGAKEARQGIESAAQPLGAIQQQSTQNAALAAELGSASADPESPRFRNLVALLEAESRRRGLQSIMDVMRLNRRERARGGIGFGINPERRDESRYRAMLNFYDEAGRKARGEAANLLSGAAGAVTGATGALNPALSAAQGGMNAAATTGGMRANEYSAIGQGLGTLADIFAKQFPTQPAQSQYDTSGIRNAVMGKPSYSNLFNG